MAVIFFQQNNFQDRLFLKSKHATKSFALTLFLSFLLMIADYHYQSMDKVRHIVSFVVSPLQYAVNYPLATVNKLQSLLNTQKTLLNENQQLRQHQILTDARLQKFLSVQNENTKLRHLLAWPSTTATKLIAAQVLAVDTSHARQVLVLDKGLRDGVFNGQPVIDDKGLMGQIIDVGSMTSTLLLVADSKCAVPIRNDRTGERAILVGTNSLTNLSLINLPKTSSIAKGDLLVTSGLGGRYPEGYPVGHVESIKNIPGEDYIRVRVKPVALLNRSQLVLLIGPEIEHLALMEQVNQRIQTMDESA